MMDSVIYTEVKLKNSADEDSGTGVGKVHINRVDTQTQCNSKHIWVLYGAIFILLTAVIGMAIKMVRLHEESNRCGLQFQGGQQRPDRSNTEIPPTVSQHPLPLCPVSWAKYKELCYFIGSTKKTWFSALMSCSNISSQLANTEDSDTLRFVRQLIAVEHHWIGLNRLGNENGTSWFWMDGKQLQMTSFFSNTDHSGRYCATVSNHTIYAEICHAQKSYICEKKARACDVM